MRTLRIRINFDLGARTVVLGVLAVCLSQIVWAAGFTDVLAQTLWPRALLRQVILLTFCCLLLVALATYFDARRMLSFRQSASGFIVLASIVLYGIAPALMVALFLASSLALGCHFGAAVSARRQDMLVDLLFGAATLTLVNTIIAPLPVNNWLTHAGMMILPLVALAASGRARLRLLVHARSLIGFLSQPADNSIPSLLLRAWGAILALWLLVLGALPELYFDGLAVHLYIASYMQAHGKWAYDPSLYAFAFMPAAITHLYGHFYILAGESAARLFT